MRSKPRVTTPCTAARRSAAARSSRCSRARSPAARFLRCAAGPRQLPLQQPPRFRLPHPSPAARYLFRRPRRWAPRPPRQPPRAPRISARSRAPTPIAEKSPAQPPAISTMRSIFSRATSATRSARSTPSCAWWTTFPTRPAISRPSAQVSRAGEPRSMPPLPAIHQRIRFCPRSPIRSSASKSRRAIFTI